jgi:cyanate permease
MSYSVAAATPVVVGLLHDTTGGFSVPSGMLVLLSLTQWTVASRLNANYAGTVS